MKARLASLRGWMRCLREDGRRGDGVDEDARRKERVVVSKDGMFRLFVSFYQAEVSRGGERLSE